MAIQTYNCKIVAKNLQNVATGVTANGRVLIKLTGADRVAGATGALLTPAAIEVTLDANGEAIVPIIANAEGTQGTQLSVELFDVNGVKGGEWLATMPASTCNLHDIILMGAPAVLSDAQAAVVAAQAAAAAAAQSAADAAASAGSGGGGGGTAGVASVNSRTGVVTLTAADVGLALANNTADANKPVSGPQQTALAGKENTGVAAGLLAAHVALADPHAQYALDTDLATHVAASNPHGTTAAQVGAVALTAVGANGGVASLDGSGKVPAAQLPAYVDDVLEYANLAALPATGTAGIIYVTINTNAQYRWSGSAYVQLTASPGTTDAVPEGTTNLYFTASRVLATVLSGLSLATNAVISAGDTVLTALGKIQKQVTDNLTTLTSHTGNTSNPHATTAAQVGAPAGSGTSTGTNTGDQNAFPNVAVSGQTTITSASPTGTLNVVAGANMTITTDNSTKTLTLASTGGGGGVSSVNTRTGAVTINSTDVTGALGFTPVNAALLGANSGVATLDSGGKVPAAQLPAYVDDVLEFANLAGFPGTGTAGIIYVALDTNKTFRWSGSAYVEISASPGSTDAVTEGSTNKYFTESRVLASILAGFSMASSAAVTAADSVLAAFGKLQAQINGKASGTGSASGTNTGDQNTFPNIAVSGQTTVTSAAPGSTLTLVAGTNMTISTDNTAKSVTLTAAGGGGGGSPSVVSAAPAAGQLDDWAPSGFSSSTTNLRWNGAGSNLLTSLAATGFVDGQRLILSNESSDKLLVLGDQATLTGTAANRFNLTRGLARGPWVMLPGDTLILERNSSRWVIAGYSQPDWRAGGNGLRIKNRHQGGTSTSDYPPITTVPGGWLSANNSQSSPLAAIDTSANYQGRSQIGAFRTIGAVNDLAKIYTNSPAPAHYRSPSLSRFRFGIDQNPAGASNASSMFAGINPSVSPAGDKNLGNDLLDSLGFVVDGGDTVWSWINNDSAGVPTKQSLGAGYPRDVGVNNLTTLFEAMIFWAGVGAPAAAWMIYRVDDLSVLPVCGYANTNVPTTSAANFAHFFFQFQINNRTSNLIHGLAVGNMEQHIQV